MQDLLKQFYAFRTCENLSCRFSALTCMEHNKEPNFLTEAEKHKSLFFFKSRACVSNVAQMATFVICKLENHVGSGENAGDQVLSSLFPHQCFPQIYLNQGLQEK